MRKPKSCSETGENYSVGGQQPCSSLTEEALRLHLQALGLPEAGIEYVILAAGSTPARVTVSDSKKNLTGQIPSSIRTSMGDGDAIYQLQFSSLSGEYAFAVLAQDDPDLLLILDQPTSVQLTIKNKNGRNQRIDYTADYLLVYRNGVEVVEIKGVDELRVKVKSHPENWIEQNGEFHYVQAEERFRSLGIKFKVVTIESMSWRKVQNALLLRGLSKTKRLECSDALRKKVIGFVRTHEPCSLRQILEELQLQDVGPVLHLIRKGDVFVDLESASLADADSKIICASADSALNVGVGLATIQKIAATNAFVGLDSICNPRHISSYGYRVSLVTGTPTSCEGVKLPSVRTIQRLRKVHRERGYVGLLPKWHRCGRKGQRITDWNYSLAIELLRKSGSSIERKSIAATYEEYRRELESENERRSENEVAISQSYFYTLAEKRKHNVEDAAGRGGRRLANALAPYGDVDAQNPLSVRPFQVAHIDHCYAPCETEWEECGLAGQPWLTVLIDDATDEPLAYVMRYEPPSFETDALVLRDCIRRHGRLPETIYSDRGSDFMGTNFAACLAHFRVARMHRPPAYARAGQPVERKFSTFAGAVCKGKKGFVPEIRNRRSIDRSKDPKQGPRRAWESLLADTERFLFDTVPRMEGHDGSPSPRQKREAFEAIYGKQGIKVELDLSALIATATPIPSKGKTEAAGAIRIDGERFYSTYLAGKEHSLSSLFLRIDPEDRTLIYFCLGGVWRAAKNRKAIKVKGSTDAVIRTEAIHKERPTGELRRKRSAQLHSTVDDERGAAKSADDGGDQDQELLDKHESKVKIRWDDVESLPEIDNATSKWGHA